MSKLRKILLGIIAVGLIIAGYQITLRVSAEQRNTVVEIVADLDSFSRLSKKMNKSEEVVLKELRRAGVNSIAVAETTIKELVEEGKAQVYENSEIKAQKGQEFFNTINKYVIENNITYTDLNLITTEDPNLFSFIKKSLENRYKGKTKAFEVRGTNGILVDYAIASFSDISLGIMEEDLARASEMNFSNMVPRIQNYRDLTIEEIDELYNMLKKYKVRTIIFAGNEVLGFDSADEEYEKLQYIGKKFSEPGQEIITAILEKPSDTSLENVQRGITKLSEYSNYVNTKVFSVDEAQLAKLSPAAVADQWGRAISQRNARIIYLRPISISYKTAEQNFESTLTAVREISSRIEYMGMQKGIAKGFGQVNQNVIVKIAIAIATFAAGVLILTYFFKKNWWMYIGLILGSILIATIYFIPMLYDNFGTLMDKFFAFAAANIFPSISALYLFYSYKKNEGKKLTTVQLIKESIIVLVVSALIAAVGGIFVGAILSGSKYILKLDTFSGVKLSFLLPLAFFAGAFVLNLGIFTDKDGKPLNVWLQTNKLINTTVTVKYVIAAGVILLGLLIVVLRSGNTSAASSIELAFRSFLEKVLIARPRTKELIAFPILMLAILCATYKNKAFFFLVAAVGMIGIEDIVNSFCHLRMPVLVTTLSSTYSLIFGIIIGSIVVIIIKKLLKVNWKELLQK